MLLVVSGSRSLANLGPAAGAALVEAAMKAAGVAPAAVDAVYVGDARGVDVFALAWARSHLLPVRVFPYLRFAGRAGGVLRNEQMLREAWAAAAVTGAGVRFVALWDGESPGTAHCARAAIRLGVVTRVFQVDPAARIMRRRL